MAGKSNGCGILLILVLLFVIGVVGWLIWDNYQKRNRRIIQRFDQSSEKSQKPKSVLNIRYPKGETAEGWLSKNQYDRLVHDLNNLRVDFRSQITKLRNLIEPYSTQDTPQSAKIMGGTIGNASNQFNQVIREAGKRLTRLYNTVLSPQQRDQLTNFVRNFNVDIARFNETISPYTPVRVEQIAVPGPVTVTEPTSVQSSVSEPVLTPTSVPTPVSTSITAPIQPDIQYVNQLNCNEYYTDDGGYCMANLGDSQFCFNVEVEDNGYSGEFEIVDSSYCENRPSCYEAAVLCSNQ